MQRKVLIVSYLFPPIGGGGVQRALKMAKYLSQYGWEPHILTVSEDVYFASKDTSLLDQLPPEVHIHRAKQLDVLGKILGQAVASKQAPQDQATARNSNRRSLFQRMKPFLRAIKNRILIPDEQILWKSNAIKLGLEVARKQNIQAIFSTSGPNTNHLVAQAIKQKTGIPWIADFRDPWTDNMHRSGIWWREKIEAFMEAKVVKSADVITTVTESFLQGFCTKYGSDVKRGVVIHNGYDRDDYADVANGKKMTLTDTTVNNSVDNVVHNSVDNVADKLSFVYTGIFYDKRNPRLLLQAIQELIQEEAIDQNKIELHFAGIFDYPGQRANWQAVIDAKLEQQVTLHGQLPHKEALALLAEADVQLLIADSDESAGAYIPGKLFEYIAIGKPILAISHQGETTDIIESLGIGSIADPTSLTEMKTALTKLYNHWLTTGKAIEMPADILEKTIKYQRQEQARMLAEELDGTGMGVTD